MIKCKNCGTELVLMAVSADDRNPEGSRTVPACSVCGSRDYQDITVDQMQGCNHYGYFHTGIGKEGFSAIQNANWHDHYIGRLTRGPNDPPYPHEQRITALESMLRELE